MKEILFNLTSIMVLVFLILSWISPVRAQETSPMPELEPTSTTPEGPTAPAEVVPAAAPVITVWYENQLRFGALGNPQAEINLLGNVRDTDGSVTSLSYTLNGGPSIPLDLGPTGTRLVNRGDFNAAINRSQLRSGSNTVVLTARDNAGEVATKTVTVNYTPGVTWRLPYLTNWASAGSIYDQAQVVDGLWQLSSNGVRPTQVGYDRLIAIGDVSWRDFEVLVPITVHGFYPSPTNPSDSGGVGIIARWQGHIGEGQPADGWTRLGAYGYYSNRIGGLALRLNETNPASQPFSLALNRTYLYKLRAETTPQGGRYSFKIWEQGQPEPAWNSPQFANIYNLVDTNNDLTSGSVLLVAHRVDATFGNVSICPLNTTYTLTVRTSGSGSVSSTPNKTTFACNEGVTLTATPQAGWRFTGWSGDAGGAASSISFNMNRSMTVTANFVQSQPVVLEEQLYVPFIRR